MAETSDANAAALAGILPGDAGPAPAPKIKHEWYQTDSNVFVTVYTRTISSDLSKDEVSVDIQPRSLSLMVKRADKGDAVWDLDPLARSINIEASSHTVSRVKIEFKLTKAQSGIKWGDLEKDEDGQTAGKLDSAATTSDNATRSYPSSSRKKTNWDAVAAAAQKEEDAPRDKDDPNTGGDKETNALFQKLYKDATDDQRRAMVKSYQLSGGTSLSTNWEEVNKGVGTEIQPPEGMIAKKWN